MHRRRPLDRRPHVLLEFEHRGARYTAGLGYYPDGRCAEIFLNGAKDNSDLDIAARDGAIAASICLQYGCQPEALLQSMPREPDGKPAGALGHALALAIAEKLC